MTRYVVLQKTEGGWKECGHADAPGDKAAIKKVAGELGVGDYVAVAARSWKPRKVTVDLSPTVKFSAT